MSSARNLPEAIQWHEGMLLGPQHFQQSSLRHEELLRYHSLVISPFHWGVRQLEFHSGKLLKGDFRILELEAVMPDGLVISSSRQDISDLAVDLGDRKDEAADTPLTIHLAVPARRSSDEPVKGELARYDSVEGVPVADENTGDGAVRIPRLRPRVSLHVGETPEEKYVSFPLAQVGYANEVFVHTRFVPPELHVRPGSALGELCADIATRLREKAQDQAKEAGSPSMAASASQRLETRMKAHALVTALPPFEALLASKAAHPFPLYLSLCSIVGHVATISSGMVPPQLEAYDHNDLFATFNRARRYIDRVFAEGFIEDFDAYPFQLEGDRFTLRFDPAWRDRLLVMGVRARSGSAEPEAAGWIESCLIGSASKIDSMRQRRVLGAPRTATEGEPGLVPTRGVRLYALTAERASIESDEPLILFNPDDPDDRRRPAEVVLYVKKPT